MPANLPPDYYAAERRFREAQTIPEKIEIMKEMISIMPKHKGTEHLLGDLKRKIAKLQDQSQKLHAKGKSAGLDVIEREGGGQVVLVGKPNSGKSSIVAALTHAHTEVAEYPFSTFKPIPGMMQYEDIQIQLIDMPPLTREYCESWMLNIIRLGDLILLTVPLDSEDPEMELLETLELLEKNRIKLCSKGIKRPQGAVAEKSTLLVETKANLQGAQAKSERIRSSFPEFGTVLTDVEDPFKLKVLKHEIFKGLDIIRIYTKIPGKKADFDKPYILHRGATVLDAAREIHKEVAENMKFARIWGSEKYEGQRVERNHLLEDRDILEIHTH